MDIICLSHIRWNFVYQRPQHLLNRFAINNRVFVIEEPHTDESSDYYTIKKTDDDVNLWVVDLFVSKFLSGEKREHTLKALLDSCLYSQEISDYILWYYTPMALQYSDHLSPALVVYDCMDELSGFKNAPTRLKDYEKQLLQMADVVFTGGHSLYQAKKDLHHNIHPFPSSIDNFHFNQARQFKDDPPDQASIPHPRLGFYGVIDERFNISLLEELSNLQPDWHFILIGPVTKIDRSKLPVRSNIHYLGSKKYKDLPWYLSGWDIAILPFALNESTKFISPTKTPEYLSGGKPVISTSIADVVNPYGKRGLVRIADTAEEFANTAKSILKEKDTSEWLQKVDEFLKDNSWNNTWHSMAKLIDEALERKAAIRNRSKVVTDIPHQDKEKVYV